MKFMNTFSSAVRVASLAAAAALFCLSAQAAQQLLAAQSQIAFASKQMGVPVEGHFKKFDAQVAFDPAKPEAGKIAFAIDIASATLGVRESDAELPKADWFNAVKFPQAMFQSSAIKKVSPGRFEVAGKLSIKGSVRDVVVPVALAQSGGVTTASGVFTIKRLSFKIGENEWADTSMVADDVQVKFKLALTGVGSF
jgi:polyisoprenoid-binding protein YceI